MREVPRTRTPISAELAAASLQSALEAAGETPNRDECQLLLAQVWFETGRGKECDNRNVGNIMAGPKWGGDFFRPAWFEVDASSTPKLVQLHELMLKGEAPNAFRSYDDVTHGFSDYVAQLMHTFPSILAAARAGDAQTMGTAIRTSGYTPDAPSSMGSTLASLQREFEAKGLFHSLPKAAAPDSAPAADSCS